MIVFKQITFRPDPELIRAVQSPKPKKKAKKKK